MLSLDTHPVSAVIADPHDITQAGLASILHNFSFVNDVAVAQNTSELFLLLRNLKFNLVIVDADQLTMCGKEIMCKIAGAFPHIKVIGMSNHIHPDCIYDMMEQGAKGFILKSIKAAKLHEAIETVLLNKTFLCDEIRQKMRLHSWSREVDASLFHNGDRLREMLFLISHELTSKEIGIRMHLSEKTVEKYRGLLLDVTGAKNVVGLAMYAFQNNIHTDAALSQKHELTKR